jgi:prevent-host-death family protein
MPAAVSAADANREFSKLLRRVRDGESITIMSHGRPVAKLVPVTVENRVREAAWQALLKRLKKQKGEHVPRDWRREELYERGDD